MITKTTHFKVYFFVLLFIFSLSSVTRGVSKIDQNEITVVDSATIDFNNFSITFPEIERDKINEAFVFFHDNNSEENLKFSDTFYAPFFVRDYWDMHCQTLRQYDFYSIGKITFADRIILFYFLNLNPLCSFDAYEKFIIAASHELNGDLIRNCVVFHQLSQFETEDATIGEMSIDNQILQIETTTTNFAIDFESGDFKPFKQTQTSHSL